MLYNDLILYFSIRLMHIVLFQPQIPQNTGNIVRTCAVTGSKLILVGPMGFSISDRWLKRAGLDYWEGVEMSYIEDLDLLLNNTKSRFYFFSSKAEKKYCDVSYQENDYLIFGSETNGLPERFAQMWPERFLTIPMIDGVRCLNLATSVGIVTYEAWRQQGFSLPK